MTIRELIQEGIDIDTDLIVMPTIFNLDTEDDISCCIDDINCSFGEDGEDVVINVEICLKDLPQ